MSDPIFLSAPEVELEDSMGDDLAVVNAARVSFAKRSKWRCGCLGVEHVPAEQSCARQLLAADSGLIGFLMSHRHGTPFEMVQFRFRIAAPIRVMREWQRHRIGSFNETSTRYVEMEPKFFVPEVDAVRVQVGKPGHYRMEQASPELSGQVRAIMKHSYEQAWHDYQVLIESGVAKELAAYVLPLGLYSEQIWSVNMRSLFNFVSLRTAPNALREIRDAADIVEQVARKVAKVCFEAFNLNGRVSP